MAKWNDDMPYDSWYEWKAAMLNQLFLEQGKMGKPGRITAATVEHGEKIRKEKERESAEKQTWPSSGRT